MENFAKPPTLAVVKTDSFRLPSASLLDNKKVQLGGQGPAFRLASIVDKDKVRLGGQSPIFRR